MRSAFTSLAVLLMAASCGNGGSDPAFDAPPGAPDGGGAADGPAADAPAPDAALNPSRLWLAPINGSEINLKLQETEPPPF